jgi:hypothetical protein
MYFNSNKLFTCYKYKIENLKLKIKRVFTYCGVVAGCAEQFTTVVVGVKVGRFWLSFQLLAFGV